MTTSNDIRLRYYKARDLLQNLIVEYEHTLAAYSVPAEDKWHWENRIEAQRKLLRQLKKEMEAPNV